MSIISNMLGIHKKENYFFAEYYSHSGCGFTCLFVKVGEYFYDINNHKFVDPSRFTMTKDLNEYLERDNLLQDKRKLSTIQAKRIANNKGYYKEFFEEWKEKFMKENQEYILDRDFTFYPMV